MWLLFIKVKCNNCFIIADELLDFIDGDVAMVGEKGHHESVARFHFIHHVRSILTRLHLN